MSLRVSLVRHGETTWNLEGRYQGHKDVPLSAAGERQAERVAARLGEEADFHRLVSSDLARAHHTAKVVGRAVGLALEASEVWRERNMGSFEGFTRAELKAQRPAEHAAWRADPVGYRPAGGESFRDHRARVAAALERLKDEHHQGHVLVVTHGGCIYAALAIVHGAELPPDPRLRVGNTSVTTLRATRSGWRPELVDCVAHLGAGEGRAGRL